MRRGNIFSSPDHELICLIYEESLKQALDVDYGPAADGYWVEIQDCPLTQFAAILIAADQQRRVATPEHRNLRLDIVEINHEPANG